MAGPDCYLPDRFFAGGEAVVPLEELDDAGIAALVEEGLRRLLSGGVDADDSYGQVVEFIRTGAVSGPATGSEEAA